MYVAAQPCKLLHVQVYEPKCDQVEVECNVDNFLFPCTAAAGQESKAAFWSPYSDDEDDRQQKQQWQSDRNALPAKVAALKAKDAADDLARMQHGDDEVDPLEAFMAAEVHF